MSYQDLKLLKESFCEFIESLIPMVKENKILIRQQWNQFKCFMLNDQNSPLEILNMAQKFRNDEMASASTVESRNFIAPKQVPFKSNPHGLITFGKKKQPETFNTPRKDKQSIGYRRKTDNSKLDFQILDSPELKIHKLNSEELLQCTECIIYIQALSTKKFPPQKLRKQISKKIGCFRYQLKDLLNDALIQFKNNTRTLEVIESKSFEINSGYEQNIPQIFMTTPSQIYAQYVSDQDLRVLQRNHLLRQRQPQTWFALPLQFQNLIYH